LVAEAMSEDSSLFLNAAVKRIAPKVGVVHVARVGPAGQDR